VTAEAEQGVGGGHRQNGDEQGDRDRQSARRPDPQSLGERERVVSNAPHIHVIGTP
jgi:hypothetical protein